MEVRITEAIIIISNDKRAFNGKRTVFISKNLVNVKFEALIFFRFLRLTIFMSKLMIIILKEALML